MHRERSAQRTLYRRMWSERKKVRTPIKKKTLTWMTRLNFSSVEAESQNTGMFLKQRTGQTRESLESSCGCLMFSFFALYPRALLPVLRPNSVGAGRTGDPKKNVLETLFGNLVKRDGVTHTCSLVCHRLLSTVIFPLGIN